MIQTLENFLRPYVERHSQTWIQYLALAEFATNNTINMGTGIYSILSQLWRPPLGPFSFHEWRECVEPY